jgi:hypothetical protein
MSASLIVLIPVGLLCLVTALCFVGCGLQTGGIPAKDPGPYQDAIAKDPNLVAYWPLDDQMPTDNSPPVAQDTAVHPPGQNPFNGTYTGDVHLQQPGIVPGDNDAHDPTPCALFDVGGRVEVPFHAELNAAPFTLECWVQPAWVASDKNIHAVVVTTNLDPTANSGYALFCDDTNVWNASIGLGPGANPGFKTTTPAATSQPVMPGSNQVFYLALTFDGKNVLNLFVSQAGPAQTFNMTPYAQLTLASGDNFAPSGGSLPLFIGMGRPDLPASMQYPFIGKIQDVAFYSFPLSAPQLQAHFNLGNTA